MKKKLSKRFKKLLSVSKDEKPLKIEDAIGKVKTNCTAKFDESIDVSLSLNLKHKKESYSFLAMQFPFKMYKISSQLKLEINYENRYWRHNL